MKEKYGECMGDYLGEWFVWVCVIIFGVMPVFVSELHGSRGIFCSYIVCWMTGSTLAFEIWRRIRRLEKNSIEP